MASKWPRVCRCDICARFGQQQQYNFFGRWIGFEEFRGVCGICKRDDLPIVPWLPDLLKEFLLVERLCCYCRNSIRYYVNHEWELCWKDSPDEALKWAMCDWIRNHHWHWHFLAALDGIADMAEGFRRAKERHPEIGWRESGSDRA